MKEKYEVKRSGNNVTTDKHLMDTVHHLSLAHPPGCWRSGGATAKTAPKQS